MRSNRNAESYSRFSVFTSTLWIRYQQTLTKRRNNGDNSRIEVPTYNKYLEPTAAFCVLCCCWQSMIPNLTLIRRYFGGGYMIA